MMTETLDHPEAASPADRFLPGLVLLFVASGCAALVYEIVWFQMLSLVVGSSSISLGVLLATFMGGMCIGSIGLARYVSNREHPLKVYALLEVGIGVFGLLVLWLLPHVGGLYTALGGPGMIGIMIRALFCAAFLLPPTIMMGATLPAISRWVETTPRGVSWLGFFYGGNTFGAVLGCLLAGFYLLRVHDMAVATYVAVALNLTVAGLGWLLASQTPYEAADADADAEPVEMAPGSQLVLVAIGISGATALGAEVVWTRLMTLNFGGTTYTFSLILASFLFGIGIGSTVGAVMARYVIDAKRALGWMQFLVVLGLAWAAYLLTQAIPFWPVNPAIAIDPWFNFQFDFVRAVLTALPAAALWGASFPLALAAVASKGQDPGRLVGKVYAANTVGAIFGALLSSIIMIGWLGTQRTQQLMILLAATGALILLAARWNTERGRIELQPTGLGRGVFVLVTALVMAWTVVPVPALLVGYGRYSATYNSPAYMNFIFVGEGMNSSMAVSELSNGVRNYHNAGKIQFGPGGYMWISTGDGFEPANAQDSTNLRGSIIRIDVNGASPYGIPPDNPFVSDPEALPEIWMYGLRNPWRFHIDHQEGLAYITDVGHLRREEINIVPWNSPGTNFGWPILEGSRCMQEGCSTEGITLPTLEYSHDEGCAIIGGVVYRGRMFPEFDGHYFYADLCGFVRSFRYEGGEITLERQWWGDELGTIIAIADGPDGELWMTTLEGLVYQFEPRPEDSGF